MEWYTILFFTVFIIFFIKLFVSWFAGDFDLDVDFDDVDDFDLSSAFSFKGILHFLMGFSSYLYLRSNMNGIEKINGIAQFQFSDYFIGILCGFILSIILYFAYKIAMKANNISSSPEDLIEVSKGTIYLNLNNGKYIVSVHTQAGTINVEAFGKQHPNLSIGTKVKLRKEDSNYYIQTIYE
jgi:hypothetical protein